MNAILRPKQRLQQPAMQQRFQLGPFQIEPLTGQVIGPNGAAHIQPKVMDVLLCLAERPGEVIGRDELIEKVWRRPISDTPLNRCISELRQALADQRENPTYIQTIPTRGYRLLVPLIPVASTTSPPNTPPTPGSRVRRNAVFSFGLAILVLSIGAAFYSWMPKESSFALEPREWVVLADFENHTDEPMLTALGQAFRIGLEQSKRANVLSPGRVSQSLALMKEPDNVSLDRAKAIEVARREQIKAVITAGIVGAGNHYLLSAEIVDAVRDRSVDTEIVVAESADNLLPALDQIVQRIRHRLGESLDEMEESSLPLEKATTTSLPALRAYSLALDKVAKGKFREAVDLFESAIELDPKFALAYAKLGSTYSNMGASMDLARANWDRALEESDGLPYRERLHIEASKSWSESPEEMYRSWARLANLFPDYATGHHNLGVVNYYFRNDFDAAALNFERASELPDPWTDASFYYLGYMRLALGDTTGAVEAFRIALDVYGNEDYCGLIDAHIVARNYDEAMPLLQKALVHPTDEYRLWAGSRLTAFFVDRGQLQNALTAVARGLAVAEELGATEEQHRHLAAEAAIQIASGETEQARAGIQSLVDDLLAELANEPVPLEPMPLMRLSILGKAAVRAGDLTLARGILTDAQTRSTASEFSLAADSLRILEAEIAGAENGVAEAIEMLEQVKESTNLFQARESLARAYRAAGRSEDAVQEYDWIVANRGRAFAEWSDDHFGREFSILDWATSFAARASLHAQTGHPDLARQDYEELFAHWSEADANNPAISLARKELNATKE